MRWRGRRPSAVTAVVRHRRDGRSGGASCGLERDSLVRLRDDLAGRLEVPELFCRRSCILISYSASLARFRRMLWAGIYRPPYAVPHSEHGELTFVTPFCDDFPQLFDR